MFNKIFNKNGLTGKQRKSIKILSTTIEEIEVWTNFYMTKNKLAMSCK